MTFEPPTDRRGVAVAMARASVFLHGSRSETFGVVAAEALAAGLPVVATDSGGVTEILGTEAAALGAVVPPDDVAAMARAIAEVLDRRATFDPERARASVRRRYGAAAVADRLIAIYEAAIDEHGRRTDRPDRGRSRAPAGRAGHPVAAAAPLDPTPPVRVLLALDPDRAKIAERLTNTVRSRLVVITSAASDGPSAAVFGHLITVELGRRAERLQTPPPSPRARSAGRASRRASATPWPSPAGVVCCRARNVWSGCAGQPDCGPRSRPRSRWAIFAQAASSSSVATASTTWRRPAWRGPASSGSPRAGSGGWATIQPLPPPTTEPRPADRYTPARASP